MPVGILFTAPNGIVKGFHSHPHCVGRPADLKGPGRQRDAKGMAHYNEAGSMSGGKAGESPERSAMVVCMASR
jgi:hypothetical protein